MTVPIMHHSGQNEQPCDSIHEEGQEDTPEEANTSDCSTRQSLETIRSDFECHLAQQENLQTQCRSQGSHGYWNAIKSYYIKLFVN